MTDKTDAMRAIVAARLREARKMAGLSQGQVAKLLGMHRPTVSEIEAGNPRLTAEELAQFAKAYDVSVSWLVGQAAEQLEPDDPRLQLAARELTKLKPDDLSETFASQALYCQRKLGIPTSV
jgi:transcriptional regulator with XRE-family HTH domain